MQTTITERELAIQEHRIRVDQLKLDILGSLPLEDRLAAIKHMYMTPDSVVSASPADSELEEVSVPAPVPVPVPIKTGLVAEMSANGKRVINVYSTQKQIADLTRISGAAVSMSLKNGHRAGNMVIRFWDTLAADVRDAWTADHNLPARAVSSRCKAVVRTCADTGETQHFESLEELRRREGVTATIAKASIRDGSVRGGYTYAFA